MNIKMKLSIVFGVVIFLLLMVSVFVYNGMNEIENDLNIINNDYKGMLFMEEQILNHFRWLNDLSKAINFEVEFIREMNHNECGLGKWLYGNEIKNIKNDELIMLIKDFELDHIEFHNKGKEIKSLIDKKNYEEAKALYFEDILPITIVMETKLKAICNYYQNAISKSTIDAENLIKRTVISWIIVIILLINLIVIIAIILSNQIVKPINYIIEKIILIADGNLDISIEPKYLKRKDETGKLSRAFNEMAEKLKSTLENLVDKNEQLEASEEELLISIDEIDEKKSVINFLAYYDPLTNLPNRQNFYEKAFNVFKNNRTGAVLLLDLDNFKNINDSLGHIFGDKVLKEVAKRLMELEELEENLIISRFGGDEFLLLIETSIDKEEVKTFITRLNDILNKKILIEEKEIFIDFSVGVSLFPFQSSSIDKLIMNADLALYSVKNSTKKGYAIFNESMNEHFIVKEKILRLLKKAVEDDSFKIVYQPQIDMETNEICSFEALLRLKNNPISPADFIPVAEDNCMIIMIGRIVTEKVIKQLYTWGKEGYLIKRVAINFSAIQIYDSTYVEFLKELLEKYKIDSKYIEIEITENIFIYNKEMALSILSEFRDMGIRIAIDDFGTGYSSLSYLTFLPVDCIKIDRSLCIRFLGLDSTITMESLIALIHSLKLEVVAEGIESQNQVKQLEKCKCDIIQGYYFSHPIEAEDVVLPLKTKL